jgi:hypothetical protein
MTDQTEDEFRQELRRRIADADAHPEHLITMSLEELAEHVGPAAAQALEDVKAEQTRHKGLGDP